MINNLQLVRPWGRTAPYILPLNSLYFAHAVLVDVDHERFV